MPRALCRAAACGARGPRRQRTFLRMHAPRRPCRLHPTGLPLRRTGAVAGPGTRQRCSIINAAKAHECAHDLLKTTLLHQRRWRTRSPQLTCPQQSGAFQNEPLPPAFLQPCPHPFVGAFCCCARPCGCRAHAPAAPTGQPALVARRLRCAPLNCTAPLSALPRSRVLALLPATAAFGRFACLEGTYPCCSLVVRAAATQLQT